MARRSIQMGEPAPSSDLAVIATPAEPIPTLSAALGDRGTRAAVVMAAGANELGEQGAAIQQAMLDAAKPHLLRIIGPDSAGIMVPRLGLDATFSDVPAPMGDMAFS